MADEKARSKNAAKRIASEQGRDDGIHTLSTGYRVRLIPVSSSLVEDAKASIQMPDVPVVYIEAKEREEENPNDPTYIAAVDAAEEARADAAFDVLVTLGIELLDGLPKDDRWLKKLKRLEKLGHINLNGFDLEDEFDLEFLFKRYVAVAGADLQLISGLHGFRPLEVARARSMFLDNETRDTD